ncbi:MAG: hypothetical protein ACJ72N_11805 [Labedaea sp.]
MDHSQSGSRSDSHDAEWDNRVERAASADIRQMLRDARRRGRERWVVGAVVVLAVTLVLTLLIRIWLFDSPVPAAIPATTEPSPPAALVIDLRHPYAGSPAATWADGAAGFELPARQPAGPFTAAEVDTATHQVRDVLVASRLDPQVLVDHDPARFLGGFAPDARRQLQPLFRAGREAEVQSLVSMVASGTRLLSVPPKVRGSMSVHPGGPGELVVHTNYVFVYAFSADSPDQLTSVMDILVVVRAEVDYVLRTGQRWTPASRGWWYGEAGGYAYSIACDTYRKGFLAPAYTEPGGTEVSGQDRSRYFDPASPLPAATGCPR